jgi:hypothetical protein
MMNRTRAAAILFFLCLLDPQTYVHITRLFQKVFFAYPTMTLVEYFKSHFRLHAIIMRFSVFFDYTDSTSNGLITRDRAKEQKRYWSYIRGLFHHFKTIVLSLDMPCYDGVCSTYLRLDTSTKCLKLFYTSPQPILG